MNGIELADLCAAADVTPRTVRYYIQQGLLPAPESRGPGAHYNEGHVARLRLIKRLQREHLPLGEIRKRVAPLSDGQVEALLDTPSRKKDPTALGYIREVLEGRPAAAAPMRVAALLSEHRARLHSAEPAHSSWERITITPDIELHVRRPLTRDENRSVDRLLELARDLFAKEEA
jgi:DNA-binding transcriptional MerR regulator